MPWFRRASTSTCLGSSGSAWRRSSSVVSPWSSASSAGQAQLRALAEQVAHRKGEQGKKQRHDGQRNHPKPTATGGQAGSLGGGSVARSGRCGPFRTVRHVASPVAGPAPPRPRRPPRRPAAPRCATGCTWRRPSRWRTGLDLSAVGRHRQVGDRCVLGLARAVAHHRRIGVAGGQLHRSVWVRVPIWLTLTRIELATPESIPRWRRSGW